MINGGGNEHHENGTNRRRVMLDFFHTMYLLSELDWVGLALDGGEKDSIHSQ